MDMVIKTKKSQKLTLEHTTEGRKYTMTIVPFNMHRDRQRLPVRKGQGITIAGWQFTVKSIQGNGTVNLKPVGQITETEPAQYVSPKTPTERESDNTP